ncbi:MFS transporter [Burkholderia sp. MR1-5-21]
MANIHSRTMMEDRKRLMVLLCVSVPSFMINLDANIVAVALSSIARSLNADFAAIEWVVSAYTLAFATLLMTAGAMADRFGRKRMLVTGLTIFTVASGICGAAQSATLLNCARALQGVGAAFQLSAALAILSHGFHGRERARAFAFWGSVIGIGIMLGPVIGGFITQVIGWRWAFYINLPVGIALVALTGYAVTESKDPNAMRIDYAGVLTFSGFLGLLTLALISGNQRGWGSPGIVGEACGAAAFFAAFLVLESVQKRPMVDLRYFRQRTYVGANIAGIAFAAAFLTLLTYLPFYFQSALGYTPFIAGGLMLPLAVPLFVMPRVVTLYLDHRLSGRALLTIGLAMVGCGLVITSDRIASFHYLSIVAGMFVASVGAGILNGQIAKVGMTVIPIERAGMASGVSGTMRFSGIVIGFASLGAILFARIDHLVRSALPNLGGDARFGIVHAIADGRLSIAESQIVAYGGADTLARASLANGYEYVMLTGAVVALTGALMAWLFISEKETAPHAHSNALELELSVD